MKALPPPMPLPAHARQLSMPLDSAILRGLNPSERRLVVGRLAALLMAAAGLGSEEHDQDGR